MSLNTVLQLLLLAILIYLLVLTVGCMATRQVQTPPNVECRNECEGPCKSECIFTGPERKSEGVKSQIPTGGTIP